MTGDVGHRAAIVREVLDAFNRRDVEAALALMHRDLRFRPGLIGRTAGREEYVGYDGMRAYFDDVAAAWPSGFVVEPAEVRATGESVLTDCRVEGEAAGQLISDEVVCIWRVTDDLVVGVDVFSTVAKTTVALDALARRRNDPETYLV